MLYMPEGTSQPCKSVKDQSTNPNTSCSLLLSTLSTSISLQVLVILESKTTLPRSSIIHISALQVFVNVSTLSLSPILVSNKDDSKISPSEKTLSLDWRTISVCKPLAISSIPTIPLCEISTVML